MNISAVELERLHDECRRAGVLADYHKAVASGANPRFAAMLALQSPPGTKNTDRAFSQGQHRKMEQMGGRTRKLLQETAKRAGIETNGKYYLGGALKATDPAAWVTSAEDALTVCKRRNLNAEGVLNYKATVIEKPPPDVALAPDLVRDFERKALQNDPALRAKVKANPKARRELREAIVERHGKKKFSPSRSRRTLLGQP